MTSPISPSRGTYYVHFITLSVESEILSASFNKEGKTLQHQQGQALAPSSYFLHILAMVLQLYHFPPTL